MKAFRVRVEDAGALTKILGHCSLGGDDNLLAKNLSGSGT